MIQKIGTYIAIQKMSGHSQTMADYRRGEELAKKRLAHTQAEFERILEMKRTHALDPKLGKYIDIFA
jgi:hypothetical protein